MTPLQKREIVLADLLAERETATDPIWVKRLDEKIAELRIAPEVI